MEKKRIGKRMNLKMFVLLLVFGLFILFIMIAQAGVYGVRQFWDTPAFVFMAVFTFLVLFFTGTWKDFCNGLSLTFMKRTDVSRMEIQKALSAVNFIKKTVFLEAAIVTTICLTNMLYHMDALNTIGPALAVTLLCILYGSLFSIFLTFLAGRLDNMLVSYMEDKEEEASGDEQTVYFKLRGLGLTDREAEVARLVSLELTNREISQMLYISDATVKKHITHILDKTGQSDRDKLREMIKSF